MSALERELGKNGSEIEFSSAECIMWQVGFALQTELG